MRTDLLLKLLFFFGCVLCPVWAETAAENLENAWAHEDLQATSALYAPGIWKTENDGGLGLFQQIQRKGLEFKLVREHAEGNRVVAVYDVWREGRRVDRVFTFFVDGKVWAHTENESHSVYFLAGKLPPRLTLSELSGTPELVSCGRRWLAGESTGKPEIDEVLSESTFELTNSYLLEALGRALVVYGDDEYGLILERDDKGWVVLGATYGPSIRSLLPKVESHPILLD